MSVLLLFALLGWCSLSRLVVMPWLNVSIAIGSEPVIANGVGSPIGMASFPSMETIQAEGVTDQPDIACSQIEILVANETDVFDTIPGVTVRNHGGRLHHQRRRHIHCRRRHHYEWLERQPSIWLNYAT